MPQSISRGDRPTGATRSIVGVILLIGLFAVRGAAGEKPVSGEATPAADSVMMLADFNAPAPNNVEGSFGSFYASETEKSYICVEAIDDSVKHGASGSSLRLVYDVSKGGTFNGFWMKLGPSDTGNNFNAAPFKKLTFWVKGDEKSGIPHRFKVELKGDPGTPTGKKYIGDLTDQWTKVEIPLEEFSNQGVDLTKLNEFVIVFEQRVASPSTAGAIYLDDVSLEK